MSRKRKRIVVALLAVVALGLGAASYLMLRTKGSELADATLAAPVFTGDVQPVNEIEIPSTDLLELAALGRSDSATASEGAGSSSATSEEGDDAEPADENITVAMESVDMPATSAVLANSEESNAWESSGNSVRFAAAMVSVAGRGGGSAGNPPAGATPPGSSPSGSDQPPGPSEGSGESHLPPQNEGQNEVQKPDPDKEPVVEPPYVYEPVDPPPSNEIDPSYGNGNEPVSVPEPGTLILFGAGMAALGLGRRLRKRQ